MKKFFVFLIIFAAVSQVSMGQYSIRGAVYDQDGLPLPGAHIMVTGSYSGAFTDSQGQFRLNLPEAVHQLQVSFLGHEMWMGEVAVPMEQALIIELKRHATLTEEVVVSASRASGRMAATFTDISREELMSGYLGQDLPALISMSPSVITSSDAGTDIGYSWLSIRGSDQSRINVTFNGIPLNDAESHGVWWVNMPDLVSSVESLQIQRGVGLSTHGSGAFGATINMQTNTLRDQTYAEISSAAGSFNTLKNTLGFGTGLMHGHWAFDGRISNISSDGYIDRAKAALRSYYLSGGYYSKNTMIKAITFSGKETTYQAWNGVPGDSLATNRRFNPSGMYFDDAGKMQFYDNETDNYQQDHYQLHLSHAFNPNLNANLSLHYTDGRGYYEQYRQNERFSNYNLPGIAIGDQTIDRSDLIRRRWLDNHFYGFTYSANYLSFNKFEANAGGGFHLYDGDHFGEIIWARHAQNTPIRHRYYDNNGFKKDFNTYVKMAHEPAKHLRAFIDLQYRYVSYDFLGMAWVLESVQPLEQSVVFHFFNPKAGVSYHMHPSHNVYVYGGIANREPVRRDFTESTPESRPRSERMQNLELGYRYTGNRLKFSANAYLMNYKDQLVLTGEINDSGGYTRTNIDKSHRAGLELEAGYVFSPRLQWNGNLSLSRNKIDRFEEFSDLYDDNWNWIGMTSQVYKNTDIAFSPPVVATSIVSLKPLSGLVLSLNTKYVGKRYIDNTMSAERMLDPYLVNDLRLNWIPGFRMIGDLEFVFQVVNLFDVMYETNAWIYKAVVGDQGLQSLEDGYFPQAGRHFMGGVNLKF